MVLRMARALIEVLRHTFFWLKWHQGWRELR